MKEPLSTRKTQRPASRLAALFIAALSLLITLSSTHAQIATNSDGTIDLPYVDPTNVPPTGTFWLLSTLNQGPDNNFGPPLPYNPFGTNANVYFYGTNDFGYSFVIDDISVDYSALQSSGPNGAMMANGSESMSNNQKMAEDWKTALAPRATKRAQIASGSRLPASTTQTIPPLSPFGTRFPGSRTTSCQSST